jgi:hypothetical protein
MRQNVNVRLGSGFFAKVQRSGTKGHENEYFRFGSRSFTIKNYDTTKMSRLFFPFAFFNIRKPRLFSVL